MKFFERLRYCWTTRSIQEATPHDPFIQYKSSFKYLLGKEKKNFFIPLRLLSATAAQLNVYGNFLNLNSMKEVQNHL